MKKLITQLYFLLFASITMTAQTSQGQMGGKWYCSDTKEVFALETDDNNTVQGKGVWYAKGGGKFVQMQIMTQHPTEKGYLLRCYDPAKPKMVFELTSEMAPAGVKIAMTRTGNRKKMFWFYNLNEGVPDTKGFGKYKAWEIIRKSLYDKNWRDTKRANSPLTLKYAEGFAQAIQDDHSERFAVNDNTFEITTFLQAYGKVKMTFLFDEKWFLEVRNLDGTFLTHFSEE